MTILHCIPKKDWDSMKELKQFGQPMLDASGFIHCSSVAYFWRVAPNFAKDSEERLLLCIDTDRLDAPVRWEDLEGCGREYPHIYGLVNREAVTAVLPYRKDAQGNWIKNPELSSTPNR